MRNTLKIRAAKLAWSQYRKVGLYFSFILMILSGIYITFNGLNLGLEFTGGITYQVLFSQPIELETMQSAVEQWFAINPQLTPDISRTQWQFQFAVDAGVTQPQLQVWLSSLEAELGTNFTLLSSAFVGAQVGEQLIEQGSLALLFATLAILTYLAIRFEWRLAFGAVAALVHDVVIVLALFSVTGMEFNLASLAAVLAVVGYSLNDSIVVADRTREYLKRFPNQSVLHSTDMAIRSSLFRTFVTSGTSLVTVSSIWIIAGGVLDGFAFALFSGILVGTWSSLVIGTSIPELLNLSPRHYKKQAAVLDEAGNPIHT
ncbi:protein translocase subunit SecF [Vibrio ulleungensis]|uniref:Protein-export membrane protein SecF n=1 Tax=Vibrio ulleungensis TaxID=2807619 RepID=A0ABS2HCG2_9VIBR|nr:protein translocase subunit SecF [Vibrio ulleungensis]MBM7035280.1 protein translocase subunit SecF [Vibrio ulleungensis]